MRDWTDRRHALYVYDANRKSQDRSILQEIFKLLRFFVSRVDGPSAVTEDGKELFLSAYGKLQLSKLPDAKNRCKFISGYLVDGKTTLVM